MSLLVEKFKIWFNKPGKSGEGQKGFAALFIAIIILAIIFGIAMPLIVLVIGQQRIVGNLTKSNQAYFVAEAGIEDILLRLAKGKNWSSPYALAIGGESTTTIDISGVIGGTRTITSTGNSSGRIRKIQVVRQISSTAAQFFYGVQAGDGGIVMANNSEIHGSVFSNGDIIGANNSRIYNSAIVSGRHKIQGGRIGEDPIDGGDALVYNCENAMVINGKLTYVNSNSGCTASGGIEKQTGEIDPAPLPIPQSEIDKWMVEAAKGGVTTTNVTISGTQNLGPIQIGTSTAPKNLTVNGTLNITGTIYVTGDIIFNGTTRLDSSYESDSGIILADGKILVENGAVISGSGQLGSYTLVLSTSSSLNPANPAINVRNNAGGSIFYTTTGLIFLKNNMSAREITGYKIQIENNAEIWYETGLSDLRFSGGPGGSWEVVSWREIE